MNTMYIYEDDDWDVDFLYVSSENLLPKNIN